MSEFYVWLSMLYREHTTDSIVENCILTLITYRAVTSG